jgi:hypothetical protein
MLRLIEISITTNFLRKNDNTLRQLTWSVQIEFWSVWLIDLKCWSVQICVEVFKLKCSNWSVQVDVFKYSIWCWSIQVEVLKCSSWSVVVFTLKCWSGQV